MPLPGGPCLRLRHGKFAVEESLPCLQSTAILIFGTFWRFHPVPDRPRINYDEAACRLAVLNACSAHLFKLRPPRVAAFIAAA